MSQPHLLPGPNADFWEWQLHGACRGENSDVFYHPDGERGRARSQRENRAQEKGNCLKPRSWDLLSQYGGDQNGSRRLSSQS